MGKKKINGEGSIRKRANGTWEGRATVGFDPDTGTQKRKSVYARTKNEAREKLTSIISEVDNNEYLEESSMTVAQWMNIWLNDCLQDVAHSTRIRYERDINLYINPVIGKERLCDLRPEMIRFIIKRMTQNKLSGKTLRNAYSTIHGALEQAVNDELIKSNVCDRVKAPKLGCPPEMHILEDDQVKVFLQEIKGNQFEPVYYVALFTGMRESELVGLTWDCIDFNKKTIHIYQQLKREEVKGGRYVFTPLKNKRSRTFGPPENVFAVLKKVKQQQNIWRIRCGSAWKDSNLVFTYEDGSNISSRTLYNNFKKIVEHMGIPEVRFHDLRHTYATIALQNGVDVKTVSSTLGHATVAFTLDKYAHVSNIMLQSGAAKMQAYIENL